MQVLRVLAGRHFRLRGRSVSTITASATAPSTPCGDCGEDDGPFFDLDLSCCSAPASSAESGSESEESCAGEVDFVISLQRSCSASPFYERLSFRGGDASDGWTKHTPMKFCASDPNDVAARLRTGRRGNLRTLSFRSAKATFYSDRASLSQSSSSSRSARLFVEATYVYASPHQEEAKRAPSRDVVRRYLSKISRQLRRVSPRSAGAAPDLRLRKSRSASAAQTADAARSPPPPCRDVSLFEMQDDIRSAIAHCKESLHRASVSSEPDSLFLRSRSDTGTRI